MIFIKKAYINIDYCVACGVCAKTCPLNAILIEKGIYSSINLNTCIGCGKCAKACHGSIIKIINI